MILTFVTVFILTGAVTLLFLKHPTRSDGYGVHRTHIQKPRTPSSLSADELSDIRINLHTLVDQKILSEDLVEDYMFMVQDEQFRDMTMDSINELLKINQPVADDECAECGTLFNSVDDYLCPSCRTKIDA